MKSLLMILFDIGYEAWQAFERGMDEKEIAEQAGDRVKLEVERKLAHERFDRKRREKK